MAMNKEQEDYSTRRDRAFQEAGWLFYYQFKRPYPFDEIVQWCNKTWPAGEEFTYAGPHFWFKKEKNYNWFKMRWT